MPDSLSGYQALFEQRLRDMYPLSPEEVLAQRCTHPYPCLTPSTTCRPCSRPPTWWEMKASTASAILFRTLYYSSPSSETQAYAGELTPTYRTAPVSPHLCPYLLDNTCLTSNTPNDPSHTQ